MKPSNMAGRDAAAETAEQRAGTEGNAIQQSTHRTQMRARVSQALERVRQAAKVRKKERFTVLLHHVNADLLQLSFYALSWMRAGATMDSPDRPVAGVRPACRDIVGCDDLAQGACSRTQFDAR
jgi:hypothetical protein